MSDARAGDFRASFRRSTGWTGGQYSVLRALFGTAVAVWFVFGPLLATRPWFASTAAHGGQLATVVGAAAAICLAFGWRARIAALVTAMAFVASVGAPFFVNAPIAAWTPIALALHALVDPRPYGALDARGRIDPGGGWKIEMWVQDLSWIATAACLVAQHVVEGASDEWIPAGAAAAALVGLWRPARPFALLVLVVESLHACWIDGQYALLPIAPLRLALLFDPAWIRGARAGVIEHVFYDGSCGLCQRAVRTLLAEDVDGSRFRFAPLQGPTFAALVPPDRRALLPDSIVVLTERGDTVTRSDGAVHVLERLGGVWRVAGVSLWLIPRPLRDAGYDAIARIRKRIFAAPENACPIVPARLRARFDP